MNRIIITGFSGFVSRHFLNYLYENKKEYQVLGADINEPKLDLEEYSDVLDITFKKCNMLDEEAVNEMVSEFAPDYILHLAAFSSVAYSWEHPAECFNNNTRIFLNLTNAVRSLKKKSAEIIEAVEGFNMTQEQKERVRIIQGHFADIDKRISQIDEIIGRLTAEHEGTISLLCTIPGIDRRLAITIISEIGTDMSEFGSSRRLCSWAGLAPGNNQSAGKKKSVKITRAGVYLKPALVEAAHAAVKATEKSPYFKIKFEKIMKRRGKKRAIIAIARMILTSIYAMVSTGEVFNPSDLLKYDMPEELQKKRTLAEAKDAVKLLVSLGLVAEGSISLETLAS